jgi:hypothetical protein
MIVIIRNSNLDVSRRYSSCSAKGRPPPERGPLIVYFFRLTIDFASGIRRAILVAEMKIAAALPGVLFMIPTLCCFVLLLLVCTGMTRNNPE